MAISTSGSSTLNFRNWDEMTTVLTRSLCLGQFDFNLFKVLWIIKPLDCVYFAHNMNASAFRSVRIRVSIRDKGSPTVGAGQPGVITRCSERI